MSALLTPAVKLLNQLRYPAKFGLIFVMVFIPLTILSYLLISSLDKEINLHESERAGLSYIKNIRPMIAEVQQHRGMTAAYLNGDQSFKAKIVQKRKEVDAALTLLADTDHALGTRFSTEDKLTSIKRQWSEIKDNSLTMQTAEAIGAHTQLIEDLLTLTIFISDESEITLDPVLDTYYLGDALVNKLPMLTEAMGQSRAIGSGVAAAGELKPAQAIKLSVLVDRIAANNRSLSAGLDSAMEFNPEVTAALKQYVEQSNNAIRNIEQLLKEKILNADQITISSSEVFSASTQAIDQAFLLFDKALPVMDNLLATRIESKQQLKFTSIGIAIVVLLLIAYLFAGFYRAVQDSIQRVNQATQAMANGDLSARLNLHSRDEMQQIADAFNDMSNRIQQLIRSIVDNANQLATASQQVSSAAQESARNLERQRRETDMVATAMEEMSSTVHEVANNAAGAADATQQANSDAHHSMQTVQKSTKAIAALAQEVEHTAQAIQQLEQSSESIGTILDVIKGIAEQTNLLALNAAIEAARAGEQGRGFAVVADEVRTLASRTQESTAEIETMITRLQDGARKAVETMDSSRERAQNSNEEANQAMHSLESIVQIITQINDMNTQIASAAEEQNVTSAEVTRNISTIRDLAEQNSAAAEQTSRSSESLSEIASQLKQMVSRFKIN